MKMAQFYNPKNAMNQHESNLQLSALVRRLEQIKTRNYINTTQGSDSQQATHKTRGHSKEANYDQERQKELHDKFLRDIYKKNIKISFGTNNISPFLTKNLGISRQMKQKNIKKENNQMSIRLSKIRKTSPKNNRVQLPKISS